MDRELVGPGRGQQEHREVIVVVPSLVSLQAPKKEWPGVPDWPNATV